MKLLILGGTNFLGRHIAEIAKALDHELTLFHRGKTNPGFLPGVEEIHGDRDGGLDALKGRRWDAVIDTCGYAPRIVRASAELLAGQVEHYTFISSISAYAGFKTVGQDETAPVGRLADETVEEITGETYGPLKALCEQAVEAALPGRALVIRPGLIVGPHDPTDRFTYWPARIARGGEVLAPCDPAAPVQVIDARDLARWILKLVEQRTTGVFNATGPATPITMAQVFAECQRVTKSDATFTWVAEEFLAAQGARLWLDLPLAIPAEDPGFSRVSIQKALDAGLEFRPLPVTIRETLAWHEQRPADRAWKAGITPERETELLAAWHAR